MVAYSKSETVKVSGIQRKLEQFCSGNSDFSLFQIKSVIIRTHIFEKVRWD